MAEFLVIDISKYQGIIDFVKVKASGVKGVIIRCGYRGWGSAGTLITDPYFVQNVKGCEAVGLPWGVYFFSQAVNANEGKQEAEYTLSLLNSVKPALPLFPVYIDTEYSGAKNKIGRADKISVTKRTEAVKAFCETIEKAGYFAGVYASTSWFNSMLYDNVLTSYNHWVAHYASKCGYSKSHGMWQYTSTARISGISGNVDCNRCYIDFPAIIKGNGLNGWGEPAKVYTFTVQVTKGDLNKFEALANSLNIETKIS